MIEVYYVEDDEFIGNTVKEYLEEQSFHVLKMCIRDSPWIWGTAVRFL